MKNISLVLVGDVVKSRKKFNPKDWHFFLQSIEKINEEFKSSIRIPLTIYSGDSFGGVFIDIRTAVEVVLKIQEYQRHHQSRIALVEDEISFGLDKKSFLTLEGPALWKSQEQLGNMKKNTILFLADLQNELEMNIVNTVLQLILAIREDWNEVEWNVYKHIEKDLKQSDLAKKLDVSQQYISKILKNSKIKMASEAETNLISILDGIDTITIRK